MSDNTAILAGFTKEIMADVGITEMHLFVRPDTDFDETFKAYDADECQWIKVHGWMVGDVTSIEEWGNHATH